MNQHPPSDPCRASRRTSVALLVALGLQWGLLPSSAETLKEPAGADDRLSPAAFADPPLHARPGCFWAWLNGSITTEQITRDLEAMKRGGMRGGEIWDVAAYADPDGRVPAGPSFLGPESTRLIVHAIREADRLGLELGLVASSGWNAGGSWVPPEHAGKGLYPSTTTVKGPTGFHGALPLPELPKHCPRDEQGRPHYLRDVAVLAVPDHPTKTIANGNQVIDLTTKVDADGKLRWEVPAGDWAILRFVCLNHGQQLIVPSPNSGGPMIDFFDPRATEFHLRHIAGTILKELGRESFAGTSFKTMEFDSMELDGFTPWTEAMADAFQRRLGYSVIRFLPLLAGWKLTDHQTQERFLYDWRKFVSDRLIESHYATGREFLQSYGVKLIAESGGPGPPIWDSNPVDGIKALGAVDIPRGEFWIRHRGIFLVKEIASAAHVYGKRLVDAESFTTWRRWVDGPLNHKALADRALCEGLNCFSLHTLASSPPEAGLPGWAYHAGTDINPAATWWPMTRGLMDYLARCSDMLRQGWFVADVCYYYGDQAPNFYPPLCNVPEKPLLEGLDPGNDYDVCTAQVVLERMRVEKGRIVLPDGMSYAVLVLPEQDHIPTEVLAKIHALVAEGATVIGRQRPTRAPGMKDQQTGTQTVERLVEALWGGAEASNRQDRPSVLIRPIGPGRFIIASNRSAALREIGIPRDFEVGGRREGDLGPLDFIHRKTTEEEFYFIRNKTMDPQTLACRFRVAAEANGLAPEFWWPDSGRRSACRDWKTLASGQTELPVPLGPLGSVFVVFRKGGGSGKELDALARDTFPAAETPAPLTLDGPWPVEFPEGWGAPRMTNFARLQSWTESDHEGVRFFSGIATYRKSFELPESLARRDRLFLELGDLAEIAEITINGKRLGLAWLPPYRIEVSGAVRAGTNELEIRVANLWANRLNGDSLRPESTRFTRSNLDRIQTDPTSDSSYGRVPRGKTRPVYTEIPPLMKSGLFGPVRVIAPQDAVTAPKPGAAAVKGPSVVNDDLLATKAAAQYSGWQHSGSMFILTTPEGAALPASAAEKEFPLLVRLHKDFFDFSQAKADGADVRFSTSAGEPLAYQVEEWDAVRGTASIWVRIPAIKGNARQEIRLHWGKADATSVSDGKAVFHESNGYLSVFHLGDAVKDEVGTLETKDTGTTATAGIVGRARHFSGKVGVFGGDKIATYPTGSSPHTSEAWIRTATPNTTIVGWGNEQGQGKVVMQFNSPPHIRMDCYFSRGTVGSEGRMPGGEWTYVVHTYRKNESLVYVNGRLAGSNTKEGPPLAIKSPARFWIGGWYHNYNFVGDIDEVRVSSVTRSADWIRLQYENQKPLQTLVGPLVQPGSEFSVSTESIVVEEGQSAEFIAKAGGAEKVYWVLKRDGREEVVAVDRFRYAFAAGRVSGEAAATLQFKAVGPGGVKTKDIGITIKEAIPEPVFTLEAPASWDGRSTIEVKARIANLAALQARSAGELKFEWSAGPFAVIKDVKPGQLRLLRAQNSGRLTVTARVSNGGQAATQSLSMDVTEPKNDPWVQRIPDKAEKPEDGQFYARDDKNEGTLHYTGKLDAAADSVFVRLYAGDTLIKAETAKPAADMTYALAVKLKPGLIRYRTEFGATVGGRDTVLHSAANLVCGDAFIIEGQSNALATDSREEAPTETSEWIRSYAMPSQRPEENQGNLWVLPVWKARDGERAELGWWGMELAKQLVAKHTMPVFIINAAVGGTRIDQHQRHEENPTDLTTIYGRMLWRVRQAKLPHGIRAILWHQGENDQGAAGPTGGFGWETYHPFFIEMAAGWKRDFPNVRHYYVFQIWPNACAMGGSEGSGDRLREKQRTLPQLFSNMSILSTLGVRPADGCHFPLEGWAQFARMVQPLIERDFHGLEPGTSITAPNLKRAAFAGAAKDAVTLEFDQPVIWSHQLASQFYLDGHAGHVVGGSTHADTLTLKLNALSTAKHITYLKEAKWNQETLLLGANGIAALTFCEVPLGSEK